MAKPLNHVAHQHPCRFPDNGGGREARPNAPAGAACFAALLKRRMNATAPSENRFAVPDTDSVRELAVLLRMRVNEQFLSLLATPGRGNLSPGLAGAAYPAILNRISRLAQEQARTAGTDDRGPSITDTIEKAIQAASQRYNIQTDLIRAVIKAESDFQPLSTSPKGAMGLMQLMSGTARDMGVEDPFDPVDNIMGGTRYLRLLMDRYEENVDRALAAYNWGMGNLERSDGRLPEETRTYISRVHRFFREFTGASLQAT